MAEPVTLAEAKAHLVLVTDDQDAVVTVLIAAARQWVEGQTGLTLVAADVVDYFDDFGDSLEIWASPLGDAPAPEVEYRDAAGAWQVLPGARWRYIGGFTPARIAWVPGADLPATDGLGRAVRVTLTAGFADGDCPPALKLAMLQIITHSFRHRGDDDDMALQVPALADRLIAPFRAWRLV